MSNDFYGLSPTYWYPIFAVSMFLIMISLVPKDQIKRLFPYGILFGVIASWIISVLCRLLGLFQYRHMEPFSLAGSPIWFNVSWTATSIVFLHFLPHRKDALYWIYIAGFALMSAMLDSATHKIGVLDYLFWSWYARFPVAFVWFLAAAAYFRKRETSPPNTE